jgi:hypothetical protein
MVTPTSRFRRLLCTGVIAAATTAGFAIPMAESPEACPAIDPPAQAVPTAPVGAGIRVFIDPATGRIRRPTLEERRRVSAAVPRDRSARTYEVKTRPDGTRIVKLDDAFLMSVVAKKNPDGTVSHVCRTGPDAAASVEGEK